MVHGLCRRHRPPACGRDLQALASFCNGEVAAVCDGNVKRVLARIFALSAPINQSKTAKLLQQRAEALVSRTDPGCYNQAMMDLGAMLCIFLQLLFFV